MSETYVGGFHAVQALIEQAAPLPREILLSDSRNDRRARDLKALATRARVPVRSVPRSSLDLHAPGLRHQGVLAVVEATTVSGEELLDLPATPDRMLLALDGVQDPHNLGACLRTAEAAGVAAVVVPKDRAVGLTPVVRKAAAGAAERVPLVATTNFSRTLERLKSLGYWTVGLAGEGDASLFDVDLTGPLVLVLGAEGDGLRRLTREHCDHVVRIPMQGAIESLNVSAAAAICLYEAWRQRAGAGRRARPR